jgi:hypothetical protein
VSRENERWTARLTMDDEVLAYCPECDERGFGTEPRGGSSRLTLSSVVVGTMLTALANARWMSRGDQYTVTP